MSSLAAPQDLPDVLEAVTASLTFAERPAEKLYTYTFKLPAGAAHTNLVPATHSVRIANARPIADRLSLDAEGFAVVRRRTAVRDFWDEAQTLALGHPEAAQIVREATGARRVVVFDHTLRRRTGASDPTKDGARQPANSAHVDQTVRSGPQRVRDIMGDEAGALLSRRAAIINVWRPVAHPAFDWPLALTDARSIAPGDLLPSDLIFPHRRGETYAIAYNPAQRWYFIPDLHTDEAILIKCWDSDETVARFAPHSGFENPATPPGTPPRESIEFRTIAFFD
jgi:hypothetical protein